MLSYEKVKELDQCPFQKDPNYSSFQFSHLTRASNGKLVFKQMLRTFFSL